MIRIISLLSMLLASSIANAQVIPEYELGGASKPKPDLTFKKEGQYKRVHQASLRLILRGELDKTEAFLNEYLEKHPEDAESYYMLGILHGQRGNLEKAEQLMMQALKVGLPEGRLLAGPREMFKPFQKAPWYTALHAKYADRLVHGPLVGNVFCMKRQIGRAHV